jgi:hypothetical protein
VYSLLADGDVGKTLLLILVLLLLGGGPLLVAIMLVLAACVRYVFTGQWPE